eukprot:2217022-Rhodomonas_salina.1
MKEGAEEGAGAKEEERWSVGAAGSEYVEPHAHDKLEVPPRSRAPHVWEVGGELGCRSEEGSWGAGDCGKGVAPAEDGRVWDLRPVRAAQVRGPRGEDEREEGQVLGVLRGALRPRSPRRTRGPRLARLLPTLAFSFLAACDGRG